MPKYRVLTGRHSRWVGGKDGSRVVYGPGDAIELSRAVANSSVFKGKLEPWTDPVLEDDDEPEAETKVSKPKGPTVPPLPAPVVPPTVAPPPNVVPPPTKPPTKG